VPLQNAGRQALDSRLLGAPRLNHVHLLPYIGKLFATAAAKRDSYLIGPARKTSELEHVGARRIFPIELDLGRPVEIVRLGDDFDGTVRRVRLNRRPND